MAACVSPMASLPHDMCGGPAPAPAGNLDTAGACDFPRLGLLGAQGSHARSVIRVRLATIPLMRPACQASLATLGSFYHVQSVLAREGVGHLIKHLQCPGLLVGSVGANGEFPPARMAASRGMEIHHCYEGLSPVRKSPSCTCFLDLFGRGRRLARRDSRRELSVYSCVPK